MQTLKDKMRERLVEALIRKSANTCSRWAQQYVILPKPVEGPLRFDRFPWSPKMYDCERNWVGMKAAQMAFTQAALCRAIFSNDIRRISWLYILPKRTPDASDFSKTKFDSLVDSSPHLEKLYNVRNVGHKQAGTVDFFLRGARSRSGLKAISVGGLTWDEFDEMPQANISLGEERQSGYDEADRQDIKLSTPTIPEFGIHRQYLKSNQQHFMFKCPHCSLNGKARWIELIYPDSFVLTTDDILDEEGLRKSHYICHHCKGVLPQEAKSEWLGPGRCDWFPTANHNASVDGFHINQMYSFAIQPWKIAESILKAQYDPAEEAELHNSKLGLPKLTQGARLGDDDLAFCIGTHSQADPPPLGQLITMGIDVGKVLYIRIQQWLLPDRLGADLNLYAIGKVLKSIKITDFDHIPTLFREFNISHCVIDANPETRESQRISDMFPGFVSLCIFNYSEKGRGIKHHPNPTFISVNRTNWLDVSQGRYKKGKTQNGGIILPRDLSTEAKTHLKSLVRVQKKDSDGHPVSRYISLAQDHDAFAALYADIALPLAVARTENKDVSVYL